MMLKIAINIAGEIPMPDGSDKAIAYIRSERGLAVRIAKACKIDRGAVYQWTRVPIERVHVVAKFVKMKPEQIRPDIFKRR